MTQNTVIINGKRYDALTGMPLEEQAHGEASEIAPTKPSMPKVQHSQAIHRTMQRSQTLNRRTVKHPKPAPMTPRQDVTIPRHIVQKSPSITKFAPHPSGLVQRKVSDIGPVKHPVVEQAQQRMQQPIAKQTALKPAQVIKQEAIEKALNDAPSHSAHHTQIKTKKYPRILSISSVSLALLLLGGYFTYLNMPSLSVRVAAAQAGINASYPSYHPDGYSLNGPVAYSQGEVMMKFAANAGPQNFTVTQTKSNWDSSAVLDNYVKQKAGDNYIAYNERGLTIYTYGGNAAWVNGGILYTVSGNAPLSSDQIRHIATSM